MISAPNVRSTALLVWQVADEASRPVAQFHNTKLMADSNQGISRGNKYGSIENSFSRYLASVHIKISHCRPVASSLTLGWAWTRNTRKRVGREESHASTRARFPPLWRMTVGIWVSVGQCTISRPRLSRSRLFSVSLCLSASLGMQSAKQVCNLLNRYIIC